MIFTFILEISVRIFFENLSFEYSNIAAAAACGCRITAIMQPSQG